MSNTFNLSRFLLLIRRQWISNQKEYLLIIGVVLSILLFYYGMQTYFIMELFDSYSPHADYIDLSNRLGLFCILGILYITLISSSYFK